jgi:hypothetical protein
MAENFPYLVESRPLFPRFAHPATVGISRSYCERRMCESSLRATVFVTYTSVSSSEILREGIRADMESTLHRQLKMLYAPSSDETEVVVDGYRIDAIADGRLIEIQAASLSSLAPKVKILLKSHSLTVVKPLAAKKFIIKRKTPDGKILSKRYSPKKESLLHLFDELVHFKDIFPHENLIIEILLTEQVEHRVPKKKSRRWRKDYRVIDRELTEIQRRVSVSSPVDLLGLLPELPQEPFTTKEIAGCCSVPRSLAQKMAYCLRKAGSVEVTGKKGNAIEYCYTPGSLDKVA